MSKSAPASPSSPERHTSHISTSAATNDVSTSNSSMAQLAVSTTQSEPSSHLHLGTPLSSTLSSEEESTPHDSVGDIGGAISSNNTAEEIPFQSGAKVRTAWADIADQPFQAESLSPISPSDSTPVAARVDDHSESKDGSAPLAAKKNEPASRVRRTPKNEIWKPSRIRSQVKTPAAETTAANNKDSASQLGNSSRISSTSQKEFVSKEVIEKGNPRSSGTPLTETCAPKKSDPPKSNNKTYNTNPKKVGNGMKSRQNNGGGFKEVQSRTEKEKGVGNASNTSTLTEQRRDESKNQLEFDSSSAPDSTSHKVNENSINIVNRTKISSSPSKDHNSNHQNQNQNQNHNTVNNTTAIKERYLNSDRVKTGGIDKKVRTYLRKYFCINFKKKNCIEIISG
jgi:hypothetical protein